jgi:homoserine dehydrogenase
VKDEENVISLKGSLVGRITLLGPEAGKLPTCSAMVENFLSLKERKYTASAESIASTGEVLVENSHQWVLRIREDDDYQNWIPSFTLKDRIQLGGYLYVFVEGRKETLKSLLRTHDHIQAVSILEVIPLENEVKTGAAVS